MLFPLTRHLGFSLCYAFRICLLAISTSSDWCPDEPLSMAFFLSSQLVEALMPCCMQVVDVSSLSSISAFSSDFVASGQPLHFLVNNAGVLVSCNCAVRRKRTLTAWIIACNWRWKWNANGVYCLKRVLHASCVCWTSTSHATCMCRKSFQGM